MNESSSLATEAALSRAILDAIPQPVFVVDEEFRVQDFNLCAGGMLGAEKQMVIRRRSGEVLYCIHSTETPEGCGHSAACQDCVVRTSVIAVFRGQKVIRQRAKMELVTGGKTQAMELLVTAAPLVFGGKQLVLLVLENVTELMALRSLLPICAKCKKIRDDHAYWHRLEAYLTSHMNIDLTHGLCPQCAQEMFPGFVPSGPG